MSINKQHNSYFSKGGGLFFNILQNQTAPKQFLTSFHLNQRHRPNVKMPVKWFSANNSNEMHFNPPPPSPPFSFSRLLISCAAFDGVEAGTVCHSRGALGTGETGGHAMKIWLSTCPPQFIKRPSERGAGILTLIIRSLGGNGIEKQAPHPVVPRSKWDAN